MTSHFLFNGRQLESMNEMGNSLERERKVNNMRVEKEFFSVMVHGSII